MNYSNEQKSFIDEQDNCDWQVFWKFHHKEFEASKKLEAKLGYNFNDIRYLYQALAHRSGITELKCYLKRKKSDRSIKLPWNERIEFLGDSVLGLCISDYLWQRSENFDEGELSRIRAALVREDTLAEIAKNLQLGQCIAMSKGERKAGGFERASLLADAFESVLGAVYLDSGFEESRNLIQKLFHKYWKNNPSTLVKDYKSQLQELYQEKLQLVPEYITIQESGPAHQKKFEIAVQVNGKTLGHAWGESKKKASQKAAESARKKFNEEEIKK